MSSRPHPTRVFRPQVIVIFSILILSFLLGAPLLVGAARQQDNVSNWFRQQFRWELRATKVLIAVPAPHAAVFGTITVTSTSGAANVVGVCTLRDAITAANTDTPQGGCPAGNGDDTIELPANSTITLTAVDNGANGLPLITTPITIQGKGATITRDGMAPAFRFFEVAPAGDLTLNDLTLSNGSAAGIGVRGGAIRMTNGGKLTLNNSTLLNNQSDDEGGAIENQSGDVTLNNSTFSGNMTTGGEGDGGAYNSESNDSTLEVNNCLFVGNIAYDDGGAIDNDDGQFIITNSYFLNNQATAGGADGYGGAVEDRSDFNNTISGCTFSGNSATEDGGAIFMREGSGTLTVTNCTFYNNTATKEGGAIKIRDEGNKILVINCTIASNKAPVAGGVARANLGGSVTLRNTIIANNTGGTNCAGSFNTGTNNLEFSGPTVTCGTGTTIADPLLGPLQYNGGPLAGATGTQQGVPTMLPQATSPAVDTANTTYAPATDQRGFGRPVGGGPDIGAVEVGALTPPLLSVKLGGRPNNAGIGDPAICLDPGGLVGVEAALTNTNNVALPSTFTATLPPELTAVAGTCNANVNPGGCTIAANGGSVSWNGTLAANQTVTIIYRARLAPNVPQGAQLCINNTGNVGGLPVALLYCFTINCPVTNTRVSDSKAGSVLVFPYYTSTIGGASDTRLTISNISNAASTVANQTYVHLFLIEGTTCQQADLFLCLTPNASFSFKASDYDPGNTGYVLAVAVNNQGVPIQNNVLIGNAFVNTPTFADNYGAESFWANSFAVATVTGNAATLYFDHTGYDAVPKQFAVEIQSPVDAAGQQIVTAGLSGSLVTSQMSGAAQVSTGLVYNEKETPFGSFNVWLTGTCQAQATISTISPRVPNGMGNLIKTGQAGTLKFNVGAAVGLLMTPRTATWRGIRTLHKTQTVATTITIPIFVPVC